MIHPTVFELTSTDLIELLHKRLEADNDHEGMSLLAELEEHRELVLAQDVSAMVQARELGSQGINSKDSQESLGNRQHN